MKKELIELFKIAESKFDSWCEWQKAKSWSKKYHRAWLHLATQWKRPEVRETYRKKVLEAYYNKL